MRVDLNAASMPELDRSRNSAATALNTDGNTQKTAYSSAAASDDVARLSTGSEAVENLKGELSGVPDVRQQLVENLRQAINGGSYKISPDVIATRMLAEVKRGSE